MFGATNIGKDNEKSNCVYRDYGIAFDGTGEWNFGNDSAKNVIIFGTDNSSSTHADKPKNNF